MNIGKPTSAHFSALRTLWQEAFSDTEYFIGKFFETAFSPERCRCAFEADRVAAALYWMDCSCEGRNIAYLYAVATAEEFRGRGICHRLMEDTHAHLKTLGYDLAILVPGSESLFRFYEKMGYRICSSVSEIHCTAASDGTPLERIDKAEYERRRRVFLPKNGVIQEHAQIDFLASVEDFYKGDGFLLAGHCEDAQFVGVELLGDTSAAPHILQELHCIKGMFRTVGEGIPFAMGYPLTDADTVPKLYFGIAFDL